MPPGTSSEGQGEIEIEIAVLFDREAARYDADYKAIGGHQLRARLDAVLTALGPGPGDVLDAGMGPGRLCAELERRGWTASGVDISESMVRLARQRLPHAAERLLQGSIDALPVGDACFDAAVATGVLEYLDDLPRAIHELARVLRPGGQLAVSMPHPLSVEGLWRRYVLYPAVRTVKRMLPAVARSAPYPAPPPMTKRGLTHAMRAAGLRPDRTRHVAYSLRPVGIGTWAGGAGLRLLERLEAARPNVARLLATQVVVVAHKDPGGPSRHG